MIGFPTNESASLRQDIDSSGAGSFLECLCAVSPSEFKAKGKMRLRRTVCSRSGKPLEVNIAITLVPGHSLNAQRLADAIRHSGGEYFEYALSTSHDKTILNELADHSGKKLGEMMASFRSLRSVRKYSCDLLVSKT